MSTWLAKETRNYLTPLNVGVAMT